MKQLLMVISITVAALSSFPALADEGVFDLRAELGYVISMPLNDDTDAPGGQWRIALGEKDIPVYLWADRLENMKTSLLGQVTGEITLTSFGVGLEHVMDKLAFFVEAGYSDVDSKIFAQTLHEVPYSYLVGRHSAGDKTIPVSFCYDEGNCHNKEHSYDDSAFLGRVGLSFDVHKHIKVMAAYKYAKVDQYIAIWDGNARKDGRGYWEEHLKYDLSAFEIGLIAKW